MYLKNIINTVFFELLSLQGNDVVSTKPCDLGHNPKILKAKKFDILCERE